MVFDRRRRVESVGHVKMATSTPPDAFAADPVIPARDVLLDAAASPSCSSASIDHADGVESCTLRRVKYRIGESLRVVYDVVADGRSFVMSARTFPDSASAFRRGC